MDDQERWYEKSGWWSFGLPAGCFFYLPLAIMGTAAGFGWYFLWWRLLERYEWIYTAHYYISHIPYGWLFVPALVIGLTIAPGIYLCFYIHKHTDWGKGEPGRTILIYTGMILAAMGIGLAIATMVGLGNT